MKIELKTEFPMTDAACKEATGKTFAEWYDFLDSKDGVKAGRRNCAMFVAEVIGVQNWWNITVAVEYERHKGLLKKDGWLEGYGICATKSIAKPVADVYAAFASPAKLEGWFDTGMKGGNAEGDAFSSAHGEGKWLRVRPGKDVRFAWKPKGVENEWQIDAGFVDNKGKTAITVNITRPQTREAADGCRAAWAEALNNLKAKLEG